MSGLEFREEYLQGGNIIAHTSGSTGEPKEIILPRDLVVSSAQRSIAFFGIDDQSRLHSCIGFEYIGGKMTLARAVEAGCVLTAETPSNRPTLCGEVIYGRSASKEKPITLVSVTASQMPYLLDHHSELPQVEKYLIGGSAIPADIRSRIVESRIEAWESYGMTETASHIALRRVTADQGLPFKVLPGISISQTAEGCLCIEVAEGETDVHIETHDIVKIINNQEFVLIGRSDDVINTGGKKFHPARAEYQLEKILNEKYGFKVRLMFRAEPDRKWGDAITLLCETVNDDNGNNELLSILSEICRSQLEKWQNPKKISIVDTLPRTSNGKLKRK
ncbi:MAG: AMP-binding protein [Clostridium sp.]|nr:AMP-binding protein [Prevotella sp.]MCM1428708.1 AMP-binding protein [Clostridium sp.]MCM1475083.1 AMP-binding protein [Muribaculaceae bacterium]